MSTDNRQSNEILTDNRHVDSPIQTLLTPTSTYCSGSSRYGDVLTVQDLSRMLNADW